MSSAVRLQRFIGRPSTFGEVVAGQGTIVRDDERLDAGHSKPRGLCRLEVIADGLSRFNGAQLTIGATSVSVMHENGTPRRVGQQTGSIARCSSEGCPEMTGAWWPRPLGCRCWQSDEKRNNVFHQNLV